MEATTEYLGRVEAILAELGVHLTDGDDAVVPSVGRALAGLRERLLTAENATDIKPLHRGTYWDLTPKYRFDVLALEIPRITNRLGWAIGFASEELPSVADETATYFPGGSDMLFWYHIDAGIRLASSGWDRLALLLDLAFGLDLAASCNFRRVLEELAKTRPAIESEEAFKELKRLRDGPFGKLEASRGLGKRHEATHLLSPSTRCFFEFLDTHGKTSQSPKDRCQDERDGLIEQHSCLLRGTRAAIELAAAAPC